MKDDETNNTENTDTINEKSGLIVNKIVDALMQMAPVIKRKGAKKKPESNIKKKARKIRQKKARKAGRTKK